MKEIASLTMKDIAAEMGVSVATVSRALKDSPRISKEMRQKIQQSLDRLVSQNYVSRAGDTYTFLTDDEQDIAREIRNTPVNSAMVTDAIGDIDTFLHGFIHESRRWLIIYPKNFY